MKQCTHLHFLTAQEMFLPIITDLPAWNIQLYSISNRCLPITECPTNEIKANKGFQNISKATLSPHFSGLKIGTVAYLEHHVCSSQCYTCTKIVDYAYHCHYHGYHYRCQVIIHHCHRLVTSNFSSTLVLTYCIGNQFWTEVAWSWCLAHLLDSTRTVYH